MHSRNAANAARTLRRHMNTLVNPPSLQGVKVVMYDKRACRRQRREIPVRVAHYTLAKSYQSMPLEGGDLPPNDPLRVHGSHPVVRRARDAGMPWNHVVPVCLYTDGVGYTNRGAFIGFFVRDLRRGISY